MGGALSEHRKGDARMKWSKWAWGWEVSPSSKNRAVEQLGHKDGSEKQVCWVNPWQNSRSFALKI